MTQQIFPKNATAAEVIPFCAYRNAKLKSNRKGGFDYVESNRFQRRTDDDQPTPPAAA